MNKEEHSKYWEIYQAELNSEMTAKKRLELMDTIIAAVLGSALAVIGLYVLPILLAISVGL